MTIGGHNLFSQPKELPNCRICKALENDGTPDLFENHIGDKVMGCPKFHAISASERQEICMKAKLCMKCCNTHVIYNLAHKKDSRVTSKAKSKVPVVNTPTVCGILGSAINIRNP